MAKQTPTTAETNRLHITKPGRWTDMHGTPVHLSPAELTASATGYDPVVHEAPLVIGHPQHDTPAYGWVQSLAFSEDDPEFPGLYAQLAKVNPDAADMVASGAMGKISARFYTPTAKSNPKPGIYYLRDVGLLGAQPPAIKGLKPPQLVSFAEADDELVMFAEGEPEPDGPAADAVGGTAPTPAPAPNHTPTLEDIVTPEEKAALEAENLQLRAQLAARQAADVHAGNVAFAESLADRFPQPALRAMLAATLDHLDMQPQLVEFGEGDEKAPLSSTLKDALKAAPKVVAFGEQATTQAAATGSAQDDADDVAFAENADPARLAQHKAIKAHAAQHKVDYATAARAVIR